MLLFKEMEYDTFTNAVIMILITISKLTWYLLSKNCNKKNIAHLYAIMGALVGTFKCPCCVFCVQKMGNKVGYLPKANLVVAGQGIITPFFSLKI